MEWKYTYIYKSRIGTRRDERKYCCQCTWVEAERIEWIEWESRDGGDVKCNVRRKEIIWRAIFSEQLEGMENNVGARITKCKGNKGWLVEGTT